MYTYSGLYARVPAAPGASQGNRGQGFGQGIIVCILNLYACIDWGMNLVKAYDVSMHGWLHHM